MKISTILTQGLRPVLKRRVESGSKPGKYYVVTLYGDGHLECECIAGSMNRVCHHQKRFVNWILQNGKANTKNGAKD